MKGRGTEQRENKRSSICWFVSKIPVKARPGQIEAGNQDLLEGPHVAVVSVGATFCCFLRCLWKGLNWNNWQLSGHFMVTLSDAGPEVTA